MTVARSASVISTPPTPPSNSPTSPAPSGTSPPSNTWIRICRHLAPHLASTSMATPTSATTCKSGGDLRPGDPRSRHRQVDLAKPSTPPATTSAKTSASRSAKNPSSATSDLPLTTPPLPSHTPMTPSIRCNMPVSMWMMDQAGHSARWIRQWPVGNISFGLHIGPAGTQAGDEAQVAWQDQSTADVKYAYLLGGWNVETVASTGKLGDTVQLYFDTDNTPIVTYYDRVRRALYTATRQGVNSWSSVRASASSGPQSASLNDRTGDVLLTILDRTRTDASSMQVI